MICTYIRTELYNAYQASLLQYSPMNPLHMSVFMLLICVLLVKEQPPASSTHLEPGSMPVLDILLDDLVSSAFSTVLLKIKLTCLN
jgi:hypothetical protein